MEKRTCTMPECGKSLRAKGLCSTHYNQANRRSYFLTCAACGCTTEKQKQSEVGRRFVCSFDCRAYLTFGPRSCVVPYIHPSRSTRVPDHHPSRVAIVCAVPAEHPSRNALRRCAECDGEFMSRRSTDLFCSRPCKVRAVRVRRKGRAADGRTFTWSQVMRVFLQLDRRCAYCDAAIAGQPDPDHVVPLARGGSNGFSNILPACQPCNGDKRDLLLREWADDRARRGKPPVRTEFDRTAPAFAHLLPDAIASGVHAA